MNGLGNDIMLAAECGFDYDEYRADNYEYSEFDKWFLTNEDELYAEYMELGVEIETEFIEWAEQKYNKHNDPPQVAIMPKFKNKPKESRAITKNNKINKVPSRGINKDTNNIIGFMRGRHGQN